MAWKDKKNEGGRGNARSNDNKTGRDSRKGKPTRGGKDSKFGDRKSGGYKSKPEGERGYKTRTFSKPGEDKFNRNDTETGIEGFVENKGGAKNYIPRDKFKARGNKVKLTPKQDVKFDDGTIRLNRYIAQAGICSRREADELITSGVIYVNGKVVTELGTKVLKTDKIKYEDQTLKNEKLVYFVLNKPKDYITTLSDPEKRKTVLELMKGACKERIYPVGRLDRNTSGVLLFTNDGDLSKKLLHPKHLVKKIYQVTLDKSISHDDFNKITDGLELEDGFIKPDDLAYTSKENKKELGIEIHSGRNRIVRRIFEALGYKVIRLDRTYFAGLTKKGMSRGQYKRLSEEEVNYLKMLG